MSPCPQAPGSASRLTKNSPFFADRGRAEVVRGRVDGLAEVLRSSPRPQLVLARRGDPDVEPALASGPIRGHVQAQAVRRLDRAAVQRRGVELRAVAADLVDLLRRRPGRAAPPLPPRPDSARPRCRVLRETFIGAPFRPSCPRPRRRRADSLASSASSRRERMASASSIENEMPCAFARADAPRRPGACVVRLGDAVAALAADEVVVGHRVADTASRRLSAGKRRASKRQEGSRWV